MKSNGFTLIEVLAIIAILAIIATITVPIINTELNDSKRNISEASALNYIKIIDELQLYNITNNKNTNLNGVYNISENGNLYNQKETIEIDAKGTLPKNGMLIYKDNEFVSGCITINKYAVSLENGQTSSIKKGKCIYREIATIPEIVTSGDGLYESLGEPGRYIYRGANPNNYISLKENGNDVTYRIISYEPDGTIKVVRNERINNAGNIWDDKKNRNKSVETYCSASEGCNVWGNQSNTLYKGQTLTDLNQDFYFYYYRNDKATSLSIKPDNFFGTVKTDATLNTLLNNEWIDTLDFKDKIETHSFNVGALHYSVYDEPTEAKGLIKEKQEESIYKWIGKIGLLNITEYVESSTNQDCASIYPNYIYAVDSEGESIIDFSENDELPCKINNFNHKRYDQWSITASSRNNSEVWLLHSAGVILQGPVYNEIGVRPAFYLKSTVSLTGEGTETNPYKIIEY